MDAVDRFAADLGLEVQTHPDGGRIVIIPSNARGHIAVHLLGGERTLRLRAFVMRAPDRRHDEVYRRLLRKNLSSAPWRFALDELGDVFVATELAETDVDEPRLDSTFGTLTTLIDEVFESIARTGFDVPDDVSLIPPQP